MKTKKRFKKVVEYDKGEFVMGFVALFGFGIWIFNSIVAPSYHAGIFTGIMGLLTIFWIANHFDSREVYYKEI